MIDLSTLFTVANNVGQDQHEVNEQISEYFREHLPVELNTFAQTDYFKNAVNSLALLAIIASYDSQEFFARVDSRISAGYQSQQFNNKVNTIVNENLNAKKYIDKEITTLWKNTQPDTSLNATFTIPIAFDLFNFDYIEFVYFAGTTDPVVRTARLSTSFEETDYYTDFGVILLDSFVSSSVNRFGFRKCTLNLQNNGWFLNIDNCKMVQDGTSNYYNNKCILLKVLGIKHVINV